MLENNRFSLSDQATHHLVTILVRDDQWGSSISRLSYFASTIFLRLMLPIRLNVQTPDVDNI